MHKILQSAIAILLCILLVENASAQTVTLPPSGDNNKCIVTQYIGAIVNVTITYHSPNVTGPSGEDRKGKIWGQLVPYGYVDQGFGTSKAAPWRAGANENTTISFSNDVLVQGKPLKAGTYGFFISPAETGPWTLIFSNNSTSWGSFFYDPKEDALRVTTDVQPSPFHEWLSYEFTDRDTAQATCALVWEDKMIPFTIKVPNLTELYVENLKDELRSSPGFSWLQWNNAADYCYQHKTHLDQGLIWANDAISLPFIGEANFTTLKTKSEILEALGRKDEAARTMDTAINSATATSLQVHLYGRQLMTEGKNAEALKVFQLNAKLHPNAWPVNVGLARGYSATGDYKSALKYAKLALAQAPNDVNKESMKNAIAKLEKGENFN